MALAALGAALALGIVLAVTRFAGTDEPKTGAVIPAPAALATETADASTGADVAEPVGDGATGRSAVEPAVGSAGEPAKEAAPPPSTGQRAALPPSAAPDFDAGRARSGADPGTGGDAPAAAPVEPSVDVVRIDADGTAVIAGRAAPGSELIVLDNGAPVGTVTADAFGEWVWVPEAPIPAGDHEFGLVVKEVRGSVSLSGAGPAPGRISLDPAAPGGQPAPIPERKPAAGPHSWLDEAKERGSWNSDNLPIPMRKPLYGDSQSPGTGQRLSGEERDGDFVVQLAAVPTTDGARQEWLKLKQRFPDLLGSMKLNLDETKVNGRVKVVRVRTGTFVTARSAWTLCKRFAAQDQDCLVVRTLVD